MKQSEYVRDLSEKLQTLTDHKDYTSVEEIQMFIVNWMLDNHLNFYEDVGE